MKNYEIFVQLLRDELPTEISKDLLAKLNATLNDNVTSPANTVATVEVMHKSSSAPAFRRRQRSDSDSPLSMGQLDDTEGDCNGDLHFKSTLHSNSNTSLTKMDGELEMPMEESDRGNVRVNGGPKELTVPVKESGDDQSVLVLVDLRHRNQPSVQSSDIDGDGRNHRGGLARGDGMSALYSVLSRMRNTNLECLQRQAKINSLSKEVVRLKEQLSTADGEREKLVLKLQRQLENVEDLCRKESKQISALHAEVQGREKLKTRVAELEVDRHNLREKVCDITAQYEVRIRKIKSARSKLLMTVEEYEHKISELKITIVEKDAKIEELSQSLWCRFCQGLGVALRFLTVLIVFLLALLAFKNF